MNFKTESIYKSYYRDRAGANFIKKISAVIYESL